MLKSLHNKSGLRWTSPDAAANYVLFRAYESGKQLHAYPSRRVAVLAIEELAWHDFRLQLEEGWIDWAKPTFLGNDPEWEAFLRSQEIRYPQMREELQTIVTSLDEVWIVQRPSSFEFRLEMAIMPKAAAAI